jgi:chromosome partitioning protein
MPTIVLASSKGGAGKTTAAILLAGELARQGREKGIIISLIDADPNQHSAKWALREGCPKNIHVVQYVKEDTILDVIEEEENRDGIVIVDLEGTASIAVSNAISRADLVIIPCQGSQDDADEAAKTIKLIKNQSRLLGRTIPFSVIISRTNPAITPRTLKHIVSEFQKAGIDMFDCTLVDREAFRAIRSFGGIVNHLQSSEVSGIDKAAQNAKEFASEALRKLQRGYSKNKEEVSHG